MTRERSGDGQIRPTASQKVRPVTIVLTPDSLVGGAGQVSVTIGVSGSAGAIRVDTNHREAIEPVGGSWPRTVNVPPGATSVSLSLATHSVPSTTAANVHACSDDLDISDPANWQVQSVVTILVG